MWEILNFPLKSVKSQGILVLAIVFGRSFLGSKGVFGSKKSLRRNIAGLPWMYSENWKGIRIIKDNLFNPTQLAQDTV